MTGGISWLYEELIRPWQSGTRPDVAVFGASIYDNPQLSRGEIARPEALYPVGSAVRRIRLNGEWLPEITGARAYPAFDRAVHVRPAPAVTPYLPLLWSWDFNVEPLCSVVLQKIGDTYHVRGQGPSPSSLVLRAFPEPAAFDALCFFTRISRFGHVRRLPCRLASIR
jgi:hypothetical protein